MNLPIGKEGAPYLRGMGGRMNGATRGEERKKGRQEGRNNMRTCLARGWRRPEDRKWENSRLTIAKVLLLESIKCDHLRKIQIVMHSGEEAVASH